jgi:hypothetical protein
MDNEHTWWISYAKVVVDIRGEWWISIAQIFFAIAIEEGIEW